MLLIAVITAAGGVHKLSAQDVIRASGGTNISIDTFYSGTYTNISGPTIRETAVGQLQANRTIALTLPAGYEWNTALTEANITITIAPVGAQGTDLEVVFTSISSSQVVFTVTAQSRSAGAGRGPGRVTIGGLQLRPTTTQVPSTGMITNTGTTGPSGSTNYGDLSLTQGAISQVIVENAANGSGAQVSAQDILAGNSITVYSIARDQAGNFISNIALNDEADWSLLDITGGITQANLTPASNRRSATFSSQLTGTAKIQAFFSGVTTVPSQDITVIPRPAQSMAIHTQPSATAIAGEAFPTQPVLRLFDLFGNLVTTDNTTQATASIKSGEGTLSGTTDITASNGVITFSNLSSEIANDITLEFTGIDLNSLESDIITITPADVSQIIFTSVPTSGNQGVNLSPVVVQLLDQFDNFVPESGVQVNTSIGSGGGQLQGTRQLNTNAEGQAIFDEIRFNTSGMKTIVAELNDNTAINAESPEIEIFGSDAVSGFRILATNEDPLGPQTAGEAFDIRIEAINGEGDIVTTFTGTADLSSTSSISSGDGTTDAFTDGVLSSHSITLTTSGEHTITAKSTANNNIAGTSSEFTINPNDLDFANTEMSADPEQITADGTSTSLITVQLKDQFENNLITGGETITIETDAGTLSSGTQNGVASVTASDQGDGTYTATLTSSTTIETATVTAFDDTDTQIADTEVLFTSGDIAEFLIFIPQDNGSPAIQTAGQPFNITVEAVDINGNRVESFSGNLEFSSNSAISAGGTVAISDGILEDHPITLTTSGTAITISVEDPSLFEISGTSEPFTIVASVPDPSFSQVIANPVVIQNDGTSTSSIIVTLRDEFGNRILTNLTANLAISIEQVEVNGDPSSGNPDATVGSFTFNTGNSTYTATLTSGTTIEDVEVTVSFDGTDIPQKPIVQIVVPNTWQPSGAPQQRNDWNRPENWSLGTVPDENDFVVIPSGAADYPDLDQNVTIGSLEIQNEGQLVLFGGNIINVAGFVTVNGTLDIEDNTGLTVGGNFNGTGTFASGSGTEINLGGNLTIANFLARTEGTVVKFNGSTQQIVTTPNLFAQRLEILNDVLVTSGNLVDTSEIFISEGNTIEFATDAGITLDNLKNISGNGSLILNNNTLVVRGDLNLLNIDTSEGTVIFGINIGEDPADFPELSQQQISNLLQMKNAVVNNIQGVRTFDDIIIDDEGTLTLENGELIIGSGRNFIASNVIYNNGFLTFRRTISQKGWKMLSTPVGTSYGDFFNGLTLQGMSDASFTDRQPNLLFYDETFPGTDNQRWRTPGSANDNFVPGRGYFFFVFGNVDGDGDYNDALPQTLTASGTENQPTTGTEFQFPVTYTAEADTGFNMIGNPFGATIDWDDPSWTKTNMDNVLYIWDEATNQYRYWNGTAGSHNSGRIAPFQAFWVKANDENPELIVNASAKTTGGVFRKSSDRYLNIPVIALQLESDFYSTSTHFTFTERGSFNTDPKDAYRFLPFETNTFLEVYSLFKDGTELAINNLPRDFGRVIEIPVQVGAIKNGSPYTGLVTLTWPEFENIPDSWKIELYDHHTKETINLRNNSFYDFEIRSQGKGLAEMNTVSNFRLLEKSKSNSANSRFTILIDPGSDGSEFPSEVELGQNYPNPFNPTTTINFALPAEDRVRIDVYDLIGRRVHTITDQRYQAGYHQVQFDGRSLASGVYFYRLRTSTKVIVKRMTLIK